MLTELAYSDKKNGPVEQRRLKRWQLVNYLRVFDAVSGELLGHLMDLTEEGIMLLCNQTLPCGQKFQLRMERLSDGEFSNIRLTAKSLWSKPDKDPKKGQNNRSTRAGVARVQLGIRRLTARVSPAECVHCIDEWSCLLARVQPPRRRLGQ